MPRGGHAAYATDPDLVVEDLREFFGQVGGAGGGD